MKKHSADPPPISDGRDVHLSLNPWGKLVVTAPGLEFVGVDPVRAFPIADPTRSISFCDDHGREVFFLSTMDGLEPAPRRLLEQELAIREFVPAIKRLVAVSGESTPCDWEVETDHGPTRFTLDNEDDVRRLGPHRVLISDSRKLRYQIPDARSLDGPSRRLLDRFL